MTTTSTQQDLFILTALHSWEQAIKRASSIFDSLTDAQLEEEILPGKNRVLYLLGHLTAVHDRMLPLLGLGDRLYPHLDEPFITNPDKMIALHPTAPQLREYWKTVNERLTEQLKAWTPEEWLQRHTAVSEEDFAREPHRNRFGLVLNRTGHLHSHLGQMVWIKK